MKYLMFFGASLVFVVLRHFSAQRHKREVLDHQQFRAAADRAEEREARR